MLNLSDLKITFLAGTLGQGGAERQLFYILGALKEAGASLSLLCLTRGEYWEGKIRELGITVTWVGQKKSRLARLACIVEELRKDPPDILQSQHFYTNLYVAVAARLLRLVEVGAMRCDGITEMRDNGGIIGGLSLRVPRSIAANSGAAIYNLIEMGVPATRLRFLPNVINCEEFHPSPSRQSAPIKLITVGRLVKQKRLDLFLSILAESQRQSDKEVKAMIVGEGSDRSKLQAQAAELGLKPDQVEFTGAVANTAPLYREADIFVLTSDYEGTPNVVLEAMASGLPVVATRAGGVPEIIQDGETGYLAELNDASALVDSLLRLIENPVLRNSMGARAREYVVLNHSLQRLPVFLEGLYEVALT